MDRSPVITHLDLRGRTITTYILFEVDDAMVDLAPGDRVELTTDAFEAIDNDVAAWCRVTGHRLVEVSADGDVHRFTIDKRDDDPTDRPHRRLAAVISDDGLLELLSPLGFALAAALEGHEVALYFQGPGVRVLAHGHTPRLHGVARVLSRFPRRGLERAGHVAPQVKVRQLRQLGARLYACGPSLRRYRVTPDRIEFPDVIVAEYATFMEELVDADIHLFG